jgi:hypothetical protein
LAISEFAFTLHASGLQILSNQSRSAAGSNRVEEKMEQEGKENSGSSCGKGIEERGMLTEPSSGVRIKCWQCVYILHFFEILLCKLCPLGLRS